MGVRFTKPQSRCRQTKLSLWSKFMHCWFARRRVVVQREAPLETKFLAVAHGGDLTEQSATRDQVRDYQSSEARNARRLVLMAVMMATFMAAMESYDRRHRDADDRRGTRWVSAVQLGVCRVFA